jgi:hypothetical protein
MKILNWAKKSFSKHEGSARHPRLFVGGFFSRKAECCHPDIDRRWKQPVISEHDLLLGDRPEIRHGQLELQGCLPEKLPEVASAMQLELLHPSAEELASFHRLPRVAHKDPFDRLIIWQALQNKLHLVSKDQRLSEYQSLGLKVIW